MADDKKTIGPDVGIPTEAPEQPAPEPALADAETVMLEHEGQAALFEMGEAVPDPADAVTPAEVEEPAAPEVPKAEKEQEQPPDPGKDAPAPAHSGKVVDFAAARDEAAKEEKKAVKQKPPTEKDKAAKPGKGRPPKADKAAPDKAKPPKPRDKKALLTKSRSASPYQQKKTPSGVIRRVLSSVSGSMRSPTRGSGPPLPLSLVAKRALSCARASARKTSPRTRPAAVSAPPGIPGWNGVPGCAVGLPQSS